MKKVFNRAIVAVILSLVLLGGVCFFLIEYFTSGNDWASFNANGHIYSNGTLNTGNVYDRNGETLVLTDGSERTYNASSLIRRATLHAIGDSDGNISTGVFSTCVDRLIGFDYLNGIYSFNHSGNDLYLTLDAQVCAAALEALGNYKGTVGIYNYKTGEIICMVSTPTFDIADPPDTDEVSSAGYDGVYLNRFISGLYTPGSIFKVVTAQAALDTVDGILDMTFTCDGSTEIGGETINCSGVHGTVDLKAALANSCNCAFAQIAQLVGEDTLREYAENAGLCNEYTFSGMTTAAGSFDLSGIADSSLAWSGIGQYKDLINPCAFMMYMGAIANDGVMISPNIVLKTTNDFGIVRNEGGGELGRVISKPTCALLQEMLKNNVTSVYGSGSFPGLDIYAKSGTAEIDGMKPHSLFAGFIKDEDCPYAFIVIAENSGSGRQVAGVIANNVLQKAVALKSQ